MISILVYLADNLALVRALICLWRTIRSTVVNYKVDLINSSPHSANTYVLPVSEPYMVCPLDIFKVLSGVAR